MSEFVMRESLLARRGIAAQRLGIRVISLGYCGDESFTQTAGPDGEGHMIV